MALVNCKECKKEVFQKAETCPHCGIKSPGIKEPTKGETLGGCLVLIVICAFVLYMCTGSSDGIEANNFPNNSSNLSDAECMANLECSAEKHMADAALACRPILFREAKFGVEWTNPSSETIFNSYKWNYLNNDGTEKLHDIVYIGNSLRFETENGDMIAMNYECMYDPIQKKIYNYTIKYGED